ncbi:hypothetical protein ACS0TY_021582 [Phlomoides rotata]
MEFFQHYFVAMGQSVNVHMSNFYIWDRFQPEWAPMVQKLTGFQLGSLPFIYMGIPLYKGARRKALFDHHCDKMRSMVIQPATETFDLRLPDYASHQWQRLDRLLVEVMDFSIPLVWTLLGQSYVRDGHWDLLSLRYMVQDCGYTEELVQEIVSVPLRSSGGDVMRWKLTFDGEANTKINNFHSSINNVMGAEIYGNEEEECLKRKVVASTEIQSDSIEESSLPLVLMVVS